MGNETCECCPPVEQGASVNTSIPNNIVYDENIQLHKQIDDFNREENRLRYMATGYAGLIAMTKDAELIAKAAQIAVDADKLY